MLVFLGVAHIILNTSTNIHEPVIIKEGYDEYMRYSERGREADMSVSVSMLLTENIYLETDSRFVTDCLSHNGSLFRRTVRRRPLEAGCVVCSPRGHHHGVLSVERT
jgi:hypothetical protein